MNISIVVILCALFVDVAYSGLYDLFGVVYHDNEPIGGAFLLDKHKALTAAKIAKYRSNLQIKFGFKEGYTFTCDIGEFEEFSGQIVIAKIKKEFPEWFKELMPAEWTFIANEFRPHHKLQILDWNTNENELIVPKEKTITATRSEVDKGVLISSISDCEIGKYLGCPVFQLEKFVGIVYKIVDENLIWRVAVFPEYLLPTCSEPVDVINQIESPKQSS